MFEPVKNIIKTIENKLLDGDSHNARFVRGTFWLISSTIISMLLSIIPSIMVARILNKTAFGQYGMVVNTIAMLGTLAGLGLGLTSTKYVAEFKFSDPARAVRMLNFTNNIAVYSGGLVSLLLFIFAEPLSSRILNAPQLTNMLRMGSALLFLNTLNGPQSGALSGLEAFKTLTKLAFFKGTINFPVVIAATYFFRLPGAIAGAVITGALGWLLYHIALKNECAKANLPADGGKAFDEFGVIWKFSLPAFLGGALVGPAIWTASTILANQPGGYGELGLVNAANQWKGIITLLPSIFCSVAMPILSSGSNSNIGGQSTLDMTQKITIAATLPVYTVILFLGDFIMSLYGKSFSGGYPILVGMTLAICVSSFAGMGGINLAATGKMWLGFLFNLAWGTVFIAFVYLFASGWGAKAYAGGYLVSYIFLLFLVFFYFRKVMKRDTIIFTALSVVYLISITFLAASVKTETRAILSAPFLFLSVGASILIIGKEMSLKILSKIRVH